MCHYCVGLGVGIEYQERWCIKCPQVCFIAWKGCQTSTGNHFWNCSLKTGLSCFLRLPPLLLSCKPKIKIATITWIEWSRGSMGEVNSHCFPFYISITLFTSSSSHYCFTSHSPFPLFFLLYAYPTKVLNKVLFPFYLLTWNVYSFWDHNYDRIALHLSTIFSSITKRDKFVLWS